MIANVKARFSNGALTPLQPLDLEEGAEVTLRIVDVTSKNSSNSNLEQSEEDSPPATGTHPVIAMIDRLRAKYPNLADDDSLPPDGAKNYKHYLYGHPKEND